MSMPKKYANTNMQPDCWRSGSEEGSKAFSGILEEGNKEHAIIYNADFVRMTKYQKNKNKKKTSIFFERKRTSLEDRNPKMN